MFKDALDTSEGLDHVSSVIVQVPQFAVMTLVCPPEWVLLQDLQSHVKCVCIYTQYTILAAELQ